MMLRWELALCRPFHALSMPKTELFLTENRGWGVKAAEHIPRGTFIVEYAGSLSLWSRAPCACMRGVLALFQTMRQHVLMH